MYKYEGKKFDMGLRSQRCSSIKLRYDFTWLWNYRFDLSSSRICGEQFFFDLGYAIDSEELLPNFETDLGKKGPENEFIVFR